MRSSPSLDKTAQTLNGILVTAFASTTRGGHSCL